jgi:hypothetical protein
MNQIKKFKGITRDQLHRLQAAMQEMPSALDTCGLRHFYVDGKYRREYTMPKGILVIGKIHKHGHLNILTQGHCLVATEFGVEELIAPCTFKSLPGTKRAVLVLEETVWTTYHENPTNTRDLAQLENEIIAPSYLALEA